MYIYISIKADFHSSLHTEITSHGELDPAVGKRNRLHADATIRATLDSIAAKSDQLYNLYDIKAASRKMSSRPTAQELRS